MDPSIYHTPEFEARMKHHIEKNNLDGITKLIKRNKTVDIDNIMQTVRMSPLQYASYSAKLDCVLLLIDLGAHINVNKGNLTSALICAIYGCLHKYYQISEQDGYYCIIKFLITAGADCNFQRIQDGFSPLMVLCNFSQFQKNNIVIRIIDLLMDHNADRNILNKREETAMVIAYRRLDNFHGDYILKYEQVPDTKGVIDG